MFRVANNNLIFSIYTISDSYNPTVWIKQNLKMDNSNLIEIELTFDFEHKTVYCNSNYDLPQQYHELHVRDRDLLYL